MGWEETGDLLGRIPANAEELSGLGHLAKLQTENLNLLLSSPDHMQN